MEKQETEAKTLLPHHEQQSLCTTRLPYRQGRELTAVKVYSISTESNHLLIFGVPSLNLRQETKSLFIKFGKLLQFNISKDHTSEPFTETYHAQYERIQSARHAKRMLDTKNFYGGSLHVCYAPELENVDEARQKCMQRQRDILNRLRNLNNDQKGVKKVGSEEIIAKDATHSDFSDTRNKSTILEGTSKNVHTKLNMGHENTICLREQVKIHRKHKFDDHKKYLPCFTDGKRRKTSGNITDRNYVTTCNTGNTNNSLTGDDLKKNPTVIGVAGNITDCYIAKNTITSCNSDNKLDFKSNSSPGDSVTTNQPTDITSYVTDSNITEGNVEVVDCTLVDSDIITNVNEHLNYNNFGKEIIRKIPRKPVNRITFHINKSI